MLGKAKQSRSHSRDRERTIDRFRSTEKDSMEQSFRKSQLLRNESEKYLNSRSKKEQRSKATSYSEFMQNTKYQSTPSTKYASFG